MHIFSSASNWSKDKKYNIGELNIHNLPDFENFDGVIVDINNIRHREVGLELIEVLKKRINQSYPLEMI